MNPRLPLKRVLLLSLATWLSSGLASAESADRHQLRAVPISQETVDDGFWSPKREVWRTVTIPDCFAKFEKDGAIRNFDMIRDGKTGEHGGPRGMTG
jgi:hypothetical protein